MDQETDSRAYPDRPLVGVGGVILRGGTVLLVRRAKPPLAGRWSLPGGAQRAGETAEEAFSREIAEETGLGLEPRGFVGIAEAIRRDEKGAVRHHYVLLDYWAECPRGKARPASDVDQIVWAPLDRLEDYDLWSRTRDMIAEAARLRDESRGSAGRHSLAGHLKTAGIAVLFGMAAYGAIHLLIWVLQGAGLIA